MKHIDYKKLPASLFDLPQDLIVHMPTTLIKRWIKSDQSTQTAKKLLKPYIVKGVSASSDSVGLTRLSQGKNIIEVMSLINEPKDYVYNHGMHIGGRSVGIWAADNTQMFYPDRIEPQEVIKMLNNLQKTIGNLEVKIGIGAHYGQYYLISGGLYGLEADFIEEVAEEHTSAGEIIITEQFAKKIKDKKQFSFSNRDDLNFDFAKILKLTSCPEMSLNLKNKKTYPIPFSKTFYQGIKKYYRTRDKNLLDKLLKQYTVNKVLVIIEKQKLQIKNPATELLTNFSRFAIASKTSLDLLKKYKGEKIKSTTNLGVCAFCDPKDALGFSEDYQKEVAKQGLLCKIGIDMGPLMIFEVRKGIKDVAGMPINIASKIAQDKGEMGHIYISKSVFDAIRPANYKKRLTAVSGIKIENYYK